MTVTTYFPHMDRYIASISGGTTFRQNRLKKIWALLPPELFGCRRTTCSRVSLIMFSSSSSDRASAISPVGLSVSLSFCLFLLLSHVSLLSVCLSVGKMELGQNRDSGIIPPPPPPPVLSPLTSTTTRTSSPQHGQLYSPKRRPGSGLHRGPVLGSFRGVKQL